MTISIQMTEAEFLELYEAHELITNLDDDSDEVMRTLKKLSSLALKYKKAVNKKIPNSYIVK